MIRRVVKMMKAIQIVVSIVFLTLGGVQASEIEQFQTLTIEKLEVIESKVDAVLDSVESKTRNEELKESIEENQEEIDELIGEQTHAIQEAKSVEEIKEIVVETAKRVILKTYDGITDKESVEQNLTVEGTQEQKREAAEVAMESMIGEGEYTIQLRTKGKFDVAMKRLRLFDSTIHGELLFETNGESTIEVTVKEDSLLSQEMLGGLEEGQIPDGLVGFSIHKPQVYTIEVIDLGEENLEQLRGIKEYGTYKYLESIPKKVIRIGVVDTGVDMQHPDLKDRISTSIKGYDFVNDDNDPSDDHYHGTHVAGTIAGNMNGEGVLGVNPYAEIVPLKICTAKGYCPSYAIAKAVKYAADQGIDILNMSLGGRGTIKNNSICDAIQYAVSKGVIPVVAAGNANSPVSQFIPGGCPETITVGAYDSEKNRASFSNYGVGVDVSAPGVDIYSAKPGGYKETSGTSMATPHVVGVLSILMSIKEGLTVETARTLLKKHPILLSTEENKFIGVGIDIPKLLEDVGLKKGEIICGGELCTGEEVTVQEGKQTSDPIVLSDTEVEVQVGYEVKVTVTGGKEPYRILRGEEIVGLSYKSQIGIGVASAEGKMFQSNNEDEEVYVEPVINEEEEREKIQNLFSAHEVENLQQKEQEGTLKVSENLLLETYEAKVSEEEIGQQLNQIQEDLEIANNSRQFGLIGLKPGQTTITIIDAEGNEKSMSVIVNPKVFVMNNRSTRYFPPLSDGYILDSYVQTDSQLVSGYLKEGKSYKRATKPNLYYEMYSSRREYGLSVFKAKVYNTTEKKYQILHWQLYVGGTRGLSGWGEYLKKNPQPKYTHTVEKVEIPELELSHKEITLRVGDVETLSISGGKPTYTLKRSNGLIGFAYSSKPKYGESVNQGVGIASADDRLPDFQQSTVDRLSKDSAVLGDIDRTTLTHEDHRTLTAEEFNNIIEESLEETIPDDIGLGDLEPERVVEVSGNIEETIEIASSSKTFHILGLKPGIEKVIITDVFGNKETITVKILPRTFIVKPNGYFSLHTNRSIYSFTDIIKSESLRWSRISRGYKIRGYASDTQGLQPLALEILNYHEEKKQVLNYQIFVGSSVQREDHIKKYGENYEPEPLTINHEVFELNVGQSKILEIGGGLGAYNVKKDNENVGLGDGGSGLTVVGEPQIERELRIDRGTDKYEQFLDNEESVEQSQDIEGEYEGEEVELDSNLFQSQSELVATASDVVFKRVKLLGLLPGTTTIKVTDAGGQEKIVTVLVKETKFWIKPGKYSYVSGNSMRSIPRREAMNIPSNLMAMRYYGRGKWKLNTKRYADDESIMKRTIYNHYEQKYQTMQRLLRVSPTKQRMPLSFSIPEVIEMTVGEKKILGVGGGTPQYKVSHSNQSIRLQSPRYKAPGYKIDFVKRKNTGIGIASVGQENNEEKQAYMTHMDEPLTQQELEEEQENNEEVITQTLGGVDELQGGIGIASVSNKHRVEIYGNQVGESLIKVEDKSGEVKEFRVVVKEKTFKAKVGDEYSRYYRSQRNQPFHVSSLASSNPDIIKSSYRKGRYTAEVLQPGKATITVGIAAQRRAKPYTFMTFTILTKSEKPLSVSQEVVMVEAGEWVNIDIIGGLPKYTISKSNENIGLGSINTTTAIGVAEDEVIEEKQVEYDYTLTDIGTEVYVPGDDEVKPPNTLILEGEEIEISYEGVEEEAEESIEIAGNSVLPEIKKNRLSIIGMKPGKSVVIIRDEFGDEKKIEVEVVAKKLNLNTRFDLSSENTIYKYRYIPQKLSRGKYDRTLRPYMVEKVTSNNPSVFAPYFRQWKGWFGIGGIGGETKLQYTVYLPLEKKRGLIEYDMKVNGPTGEAVKEHYKRVLAYKTTLGKRSSIEGRSNSVNNSQSSNQQSNNSRSQEPIQGEFYYVDTTELIQRVGEFSVVDFYIHPDAKVTTSYDETKGFMREVTGSKKYKEKVLVASDEQQQFLGLDKYELVEEETISIQDTTINTLISGFKKHQYVIGCAGEKTTYTQEMTYQGVTKKIDIYCSTYQKAYTFKKGYSETLQTGNLPMRTAYSDDDGLVSTWYNSSEKELGIITKESGSTYINREFYGLENNSESIAKFKIPIEVVGGEKKEKEVIEIEIPVQVGGIYEFKLPDITTNISYHKSLILGGEKSEKIGFVDHGIRLSDYNEGNIRIAINEDDYEDYFWYLYETQFKQGGGFYDLFISPTTSGDYKLVLSNKWVDIKVTFKVGVNAIRKDMTRTYWNKFITEVNSEVESRDWNDYIPEIKKRYSLMTFSNQKNLSIEDYVTKLFKLGYEEITRLPKEVGTVYFHERFGDTGPRNLKFSLYHLGYVKSLGDKVNYDGMKLLGADLGNMLFGYLAYNGGFYNFGVEKVYNVEYNKYLTYYGKKLAIERTEHDEATDIPFYEAGKKLTTDFSQLKEDISRKAFKAWTSQSSLSYAETKNLISICERTYGKVVSDGAYQASQACLNYFNDYHFYTPDKKMVVPVDDNNIAIGLIPNSIY